MKPKKSRTRKFLFARTSKIGHMINGRMEYPAVFVSVEAINKDHAIQRLHAKYPYIKKSQWDYLDELDPEHFVGALGEDLPLTTH